MEDTLLQKLPKFYLLDERLYGESRKPSAELSKYFTFIYGILQKFPYFCGKGVRSPNQCVVQPEHGEGTVN